MSEKSTDNITDNITDKVDYEDDEIDYPLTNSTEKKNENEKIINEKLNSAEKNINQYLKV